MAPPLLDVSGLTRRFPGVLALDGVALSVARGEVHGLLGENGAGKSTLLKILSGAERFDAGRITFDGAPVAPGSPQAAQALGIVTIHQEFSLIPDLSVAENVYVGRQPLKRGLVDWRRMAADTRAVLARMGVALNPAAPVRTLSVADQQLVEIARALSMDSKLIIMDEPTSALSEAEVGKLFAIVRELRAQGLGLVFVTHRLEEVMAVCDRVTVLRDGRNAGGGPVSGLDVGAIIKMMVGRSVDALYQRFAPRAAGPVVLEVDGLTRRRHARDPDAVDLHSVGFHVRAGEIVVLAGLIGSGRTEVARALFGADAVDAGSIRLNGEPLALRAPADAIRRGFALVPENRKEQALFLDLTVRRNLSVAALRKLLVGGVFVHERREAALVERFRERLDVRMASPEQAVGNLSGGNQQKVVLARWLATEPRVLIVDEPTRGIDVAAKAEVHALLDRMARDGIAVVVVSSELPEVLALADRIVVMRQGRVVGELPGAGTSQEALLHRMNVGGELEAA